MSIIPYSTQPIDAFFYNATNERRQTRNIGHGSATSSAAKKEKRGPRPKGAERIRQERLLYTAQTKRMQSQSAQALRAAQLKAQAEAQQKRIENARLKQVETEKLRAAKIQQPSELLKLRVAEREKHLAEKAEREKARFERKEKQRRERRIMHARKAEQRKWSKRRSTLKRHGLLLF